jgi:hypothetical protein
LVKLFFNVVGSCAELPAPTLDESRRRNRNRDREFALWPKQTLYLLSGCCRTFWFLILMFTDFIATDRWTKKQVHCLYQALIVAIATRHADAVDIKFLVDGRPVWVALPHPAWVEYKKRTGKVITDALAKEIAGHFLKTALESGEGLGREMYSLTIDEMLRHLEGVVSDVEPTAATAG